MSLSFLLDHQPRIDDPRQIIHPDQLRTRMRIASLSVIWAATRKERAAQQAETFYDPSHLLAEWCGEIGWVNERTKDVLIHITACPEPFVIVDSSKHVGLSPEALPTLEEPFDFFTTLQHMGLIAIGSSYGDQYLGVPGDRVRWEANIILAL